jgi:uncharacterized SAM-binding protein YcdF (DUF218 family)
MAVRCYEADAIVVLGCRGPAALKRRLDRGIELFHEGAAPLLVLSGGGAGPVPEAELMRRAAVARGVAQTALLIEPSSRNTLENARETARLLRSRGLSSVVLVSDQVHLPRAGVLFRLAGLRVTRRAAVRSASVKWGVVTTLREIVALPWSLICALRLVRSRRSQGEAGQEAPKLDRDEQRRATGQQKQHRDAGADGDQRHRHG